MAFLPVVFIFISISLGFGTLSTSMEEEMRFFKVEKVSGVDESEEGKTLVLDKFRILLGLGSLHKRNPHHGSIDYGSPAPSQAPAPVMRPIPLHPRRRPPRLSITLPYHSSHGHTDNHRGKEVLVAVLVSVSAVVVLLVFALALVCFINKRHRKRKREKCVVSQEIEGDKVSTEPGFDLFYLNTLTSVLEPQPHLKEENQEQEVAETVQVYEYEELNNHHNADCHSPLGRDQMSKIGSHSSGDYSFHSVCESNTSNNARLSNVSTSSFSDAAEGFSPKHPPPPPPPPPPLRRPSCSFANVKKAKSPSSLGSPSRSNETPASPKTGVSRKVSANIPPPPCPPLLMKGSSFKGPPPLPPSREQPYSGQTTLGKDGAPLPKLKPLHWDKVRAASDRSMVWDKLRSSSFEFDEEMIESLFGYNLKSAFQNDEGKSKTPSPSKHVLEPKRLQNMTILSKALNVTAEQVCDALVQGDGLRLQDLEALAKMEPTKEEEAKLFGYKGDLNELGMAEKLVKAMLNIPFAFLRIEAMLYKATFEDEVVHLRNSFSTLEVKLWRKSLVNPSDQLKRRDIEACKELRSSRLFLKLLEAVLKTGNRMNVGTIRGGAKAFKLDALLKLSDVKGTDGKTTLLHFVVQEIIRAEGIRMAGSIMGKINQNSKNKTAQEKEESYKKMGLDLVSSLTTELCNVKKTASIDLDVLATSVSNLSDGMAKLKKLALEDLSDDVMSSGFVCRMTGFMEQAERRLRELQKHEDEVLKSVKEITEYFHGDVGKGEGNLLQIFIVVRDFLAMLDQVCRELRSMKVTKSPTAVALFQ